MGIQQLCKGGHGSSSPSTKQPVTMATDQSQHIVYIPELLRCHTIIVVNFNEMNTQVIRLLRKSHSLLDDPHI